MFMESICNRASHDAYVQQYSTYVYIWYYIYVKCNYVYESITLSNNIAMN